MWVNALLCITLVNEGCDMMGEMVRFIQSNKMLELRISGTKNLWKTPLLAIKSSKKTHKCVITSVKLSLVATGNIKVFLLASVVLEIVRRFSSSHYPFIWDGLQSLQILCCQPFKWVLEWAHFTGLVTGIKVWFISIFF